MAWDSPVPQAALNEGQGEGTCMAVIGSPSASGLIDPVFNLPYLLLMLTNVSLRISSLMVQFTYVPLTLCKTFMKFRKNPEYFCSCRNALFVCLN